MAKKENNELANRMNSQNYFVSSRGMARNTRHTLPKVLKVITLPRELIITL